MIQLTLVVVGSLIAVTVLLLAGWMLVYGWWQGRPERILGPHSPVTALNTQYAERLRQDFAPVTVKVTAVSSSEFDYFDPYLWYGGYLFLHGDDEAALIRAYEAATQDYRAYSAQYAQAASKMLAWELSGWKQHRLRHFLSNYKLPAPRDATLTVRVRLTGTEAAKREDTQKDYALKLSERGRLYRMAAARKQNFLALGNPIDEAEAS